MNKKIRVKKWSALVTISGLLSIIMALIVAAGLMSCASTNPAIPVGGTFAQSAGTLEKAKSLILLGISQYNTRDSAKVIGRVAAPGLIIARQDGNGWWLEIAIRHNAENFQLEFHGCSDNLGGAGNIHARFQKTQRLLMDCITRTAAQYSAQNELQWQRDARTPVY
ncbi:MAG: hypothetical protein LBD30_02585 [Verrucomicrobiales bacterium]|jgi:hypothetical protein|nr:hypothetical protein [Verrucomicrobiales bacterium]